MEETPEYSITYREGCRLKFYLDNADIYAFWISPWQTGESRGYTSGGGPGLSTCGIDVPANK